MDQGHIERLVLYATCFVGGLPGHFETIEQSKARARADGVKTIARRILATWFADRENAPTYKACAAVAKQTLPEAIHAGLDAMQGWHGTDLLKGDIQPDTLMIWGDGQDLYLAANPDAL